MAKAKSTPKKSTAKSRSYYEEPKQSPARLEDYSGRYISALVVLLIGICIFVSMFWSDGVVLAKFSDFLKGMLGWGFWLIGASLVYIAFVLFFQKDRPIGFRVICLALLPIFFSAFINIVGDFTIDSRINDLYANGKDIRCGGVLGGSFAYMLSRYLGKIPSCIVLAILIIVMLFSALGADISSVKKALSESAQREKEPKDSLLFGKGISSFSDDSLENSVPDINLNLSRFSSSSKKSRSKKSSAVVPSGTASAYNLPLGEDGGVDVVKPKKQPKPKVTDIPLDPPAKPAKTRTPVTIQKVPGISSAASSVDDMKPEKLTKEQIQKEAESVAKTAAESDDSGVYVFPNIKLLSPSKFNGSDTRDMLYETQERLENTLHSFGVMSNVVKITPGPTVTRYDIELEQGVKLSKVTNLAGDIALSLGVLNVRVAPIPDEISTVGIEVPNKIVNTVSLREIIESSNFEKAKSKLSFAIGKDIGGNAIVGDISKLPHMLIAGTTGSGKSVCMNSLILSLLYKAKPDEVKFIMIDPKMVELGIYNAIPHLYVPVVTEPKKAAGALQWAVVEMLKRYRLFSEAGVRDLATYNAYCKHAKEPTLPQVVILIDELADLMMAASKEVEESICRIAQMGRAAGMHLIIATQRPSADVITGLMKANIPSRIAFAVSSAMESRIIMDQSGAEKLIGHGDMLYSPLGSGKPLRVQGSFVSDEEREKVINFIKEHSDYKSETPDELKSAIENGLDDKNTSQPEDPDSRSGIAGDYDEMLPQAAEVVLEMKSCSVSMLQRRLKLGYSRAARIVDQMEELGIVGPYEGAKPRTVPISREDWNDIQIQLGLATEDDFAMAAEMNEAPENEYE